MEGTSVAALLVVLTLVKANVVPFRACVKGSGNENNSEHLLGQYVPQCNSDGTFREVQCHEGSCFCVNRRTGHRVDDNVYISELPQCRKDAETCTEAASRTKHLIGALKPECDGDGNFKEVQCHERYCFCVEKLTGEEILETRREAIAWNKKPTNCTAECIHDRHRKLNFAALTGFLGVPTPTCTEDGSYAKKQCFKGMCWET